MLFPQSVPRAGVAQYMKIEWRVVAIFNIILFVVLVRHSPSPTFNHHQMIFLCCPFSWHLYFICCEMQSMIYFVGCCARRNAARSRSQSRSKVWRGPIHAAGWKFGRPFTRNFESNSVQIFNFWWNGNRFCNLCTSWVIFFHPMINESQFTIPNLISTVKGKIITRYLGNVNIRLWSMWVFCLCLGSNPPSFIAHNNSC